MATLRHSLVVSVLFTFFGGPALVLVVMPWFFTHFRIHADEPPAQIAASVALIVLGLVPLLDSIVRFIVVGRGTLVPAVPTEHLVVSGLYRYVRNPMYLGVLIAISGEAILLATWHMLEYLAIVWLIMHVFVCGYEEPTLSGKFPDEYARFKSNVPRWIPRLRPWSGDAVSSG